MNILFKNLLLITLSLLVGLLLVEGLSRLVMPVKYGNTVLTLEGEKLPPYKGREQLRPGISYRVVSQEFDTIVTHTPDGYRGLVQPLAPEMIFIGDSFTYGVGLNDKETIPHIYCLERDLVCVNLGVPGTATIHQLDRLARYLQEKNWRPRQVKLLFMGMTAALMAGNDLNGNLEAVQKRQNQKTDTKAAAPAPPQKKSLLAMVVDQRTLLLEYSNLVRILYYVGGPMLRAKLSPEAGSDQLNQALAVTKEQFSRLDQMAQQYGFTYSIDIIHPMQDLIQGTYKKTLAQLKAIAPENALVRSTAPALLAGGKPQQYYYPMDGHLNAAGARKVAIYLAQQEKPQK